LGRGGVRGGGKEGADGVLADKNGVRGAVDCGRAVEERRIELGFAGEKRRRCRRVAAKESRA